MPTIGFPVLNTDLALAISPSQVLLNRRFLFRMAAMIGIVQREFLQRRKMALDAIQPRRIRRRPVQPQFVGFRIRQHLGFVMIGRIVQNQMQRFLSRISSPQPFQECQKGRPVFLRRKSPDQGVPFQIVGPEHVPYAAVSIVGGSQSIRVSDPGIMSTVPGQQIQRTKLIDTDPTAPRRPFGIQSLQSSVFAPKLRIVGVFPSLSVPPSDLATMQDLPQGFQRDRDDDLLSDQILPQLGQRPDRHPHQLLGGRQGDLADRFDRVGEKLPGSSRSTEGRIPDNRLDPAPIEAVEDLTNPGWRTTARLGDLAVPIAPARQQDHSGVKPIDSIGQLSFHRMQLFSLPRFERPCSDVVHVKFSTGSRLPQAASVETFCTQIPCQRKSLINMDL